MVGRRRVDGGMGQEVGPEQLRVRAETAQPDLGSDGDELRNPPLKSTEQVGRILRHPTGEHDRLEVEYSAEVRHDEGPALERPAHQLLDEWIGSPAHAEDAKP